MTIFQAPEDFRGKSDDEILTSMHGSTFNSDHYRHCYNMLQLRYMERTLASSRRLALGTWGLVVAASLLLIAELVRLGVFLAK